MIKGRLEVLMITFAALFSAPGTQELREADPVVWAMFFNETEQVGIFTGRPRASACLLRGRYDEKMKARKP